MKPVIIFAYSIICYLAFVATVAYAFGFFGNLLVPKSIDSAPQMPFVPALAINIALVCLFALQHSLMARPAFKRRLTRYIPPEAERATYVLASSLALAALMWLWQPLGGVIWTVVHHRATIVLTVAYVCSWCLLVYASFLLDHFELFGLRQAWCALRGRAVPQRTFSTPTLYRYVRHPIYLAWLGILWLTPTMTLTHLVLAIGFTVYVLLAIPLEERDLEAIHPQYRQYRSKVPALLPSLRRRLRRHGSLPGGGGQLQQ